MCFGGYDTKLFHVKYGTMCDTHNTTGSIKQCKPIKVGSIGVGGLCIRTYRYLFYNACTTTLLSAFIAITFLLIQESS